MSSFDNLNTLESVIKAYEHLCVEEKQVEDEINELLNKSDDFDSEIKSLKKDMPNMQLIESDVLQLGSMINFTSTLAENVSCKVRRLDLAKTRVAQCLQRVGDILDLKFCTDGIQKALMTEDYEQAAAHIHRFLSMDESDLRNYAVDEGPSGGKVENGLNASSMDEAFIKLHEAEIKLKNIVMKRFDEAVRDDDVASVERYFKIFPLLNQHQEGLKKFSTYLCTKISDKALIKNIPSTNLTHCDKLAQLYETIAKIIDIHQPLVETYYGPGKLISVIEILQKECDRQSKRIFDDFKSKKLLQHAINMVTKSLKPLATSKVDPKEIDQLVSELIMLNGRSEMYFRFISKRARNDVDIAYPESNEKTEYNQERNAKLNQIDLLIRNSELNNVMHEINGVYVLMEEYFMKESALKAIQLDSVETTGSLTSSVLDDVFFIVKKCIKRALSGGSVDVVCAIINHSVALLESSFCETLNERLQNGYPSAATITGAAAALDLTQAYNAIQTGVYLQSTSEVEKARSLFVTALNNLDVACEYVDTLKTNLNDDFKKAGINQIQNESQSQKKLESCLSDLVSLTGRFKSIVTSGLHQICSSMFKPRIKSWIDTFLNSNHVLTEDDLTSFEATDGLRPFTQTFIISIDSLMKTFKEVLTQNNYDTLLSLFSTELIQRLGNAVLKCNYNKVSMKVY